MTFTLSMTGPGWTRARPLGKPLPNGAGRTGLRQRRTVLRLPAGTPARPDASGCDDAIAALLALGVSEREARQLVARALADGASGTADVITWACQRRGGKAR